MSKPIQPARSGRLTLGSHDWRSRLKCYKCRKDRKACSYSGRILLDPREWVELGNPRCDKCQELVDRDRDRSRKSIPPHNDLYRKCGSWGPQRALRTEGLQELPTFVPSEFNKNVAGTPGDMSFENHPGQPSGPALSPEYLIPNIPNDTLPAEHRNESSWITPGGLGANSQVSWDGLPQNPLASLEISSTGSSHDIAERNDPHPGEPPYSSTNAAPFTMPMDMDYLQIFPENFDFGHEPEATNPASVENSHAAAQSRPYGSSYEAPLAPGLTVESTAGGSLQEPGLLTNTGIYEAMRDMFTYDRAHSPYDPGNSQELIQHGEAPEPGTLSDAPGERPRDRGVLARETTEHPQNVTLQEKNKRKRVDSPPAQSSEPTQAASVLVQPVSESGQGSTESVLPGNEPGTAAIENPAHIKNDTDNIAKGVSRPTNSGFRNRLLHVQQLLGANNHDELFVLVSAFIKDPAPDRMISPDDLANFIHSLILVSRSRSGPDVGGLHGQAILQEGHRDLLASLERVRSCVDTTMQHLRHYENAPAPQRAAHEIGRRKSVGNPPQKNVNSSTPRMQRTRPPAQEGLPDTPLVLAARKGDQSDLKTLLIANDAAGNGDAELLPALYAAIKAGMVHNTKLLAKRVRDNEAERLAQASNDPAMIQIFQQANGNKTGFFDGLSVFFVARLSSEPKDTHAFPTWGSMTLA